jgi:plastocyanin
LFLWLRVILSKGTGMKRTRRLILTVIVLLLTACGESGQVTQADAFTVRAGTVGKDAPSDLGVFDFYASHVKVHPGDLIRFENGSGMIPVPHTVTLGRASDIPDRLPPPVLPKVGQVPLVWGQCVAPEALRPGITECPDGSRAAFPPSGPLITMPAFRGQGYYNSGIFDRGQTVEVPIAQDTRPGSYAFFCYLHPATMDLTVEVVPQDQPTQTQANLDTQATRQIKDDVTDGLAAEQITEHASLPAGTVQAGAEQGKAVITRFFPARITVPAGSTVTWVNNGADPHVIAFGGTVGPHDEKNFAPPTVPSGSDYRGGFAISGVIGALFPSQTYALRFPDPGRYVYLCPIHPGMAGIVEAI